MCDHADHASGGANYNFSSHSWPLGGYARSTTVAADPQKCIYGDTDPARDLRDRWITLREGQPRLIGGLATATTIAFGVEVDAITRGSLAVGCNYALTFTEISLTMLARPLTIAAAA